MRTDEQTAAHLRALEEEREGYARSGREDRVRQVEAEISRIRGGEPKQTRPRGAGKQTR